eukprot:m.31715 g.31715  ORF g.31715 m.31715 type:complete len:489 (-) comp9338_c0_seq3:174-1640(-)
MVDFCWLLFCPYSLLFSSHRLEHGGPHGTTISTGMEEVSALTPLDGRYAARTKRLRDFFSEKAYIQYRVEIEIKWLLFLSEQQSIPEVPAFSPGAREVLLNAVKNFSCQDALSVKKFEEKTNHDVKAMEYWLKETLKDHPEIVKVSEFIHFACTSEDVNNLAIARMMSDARAHVLIPELQAIQGKLSSFAHTHAAVPMLARTHGQPATPTTAGKEFAIFAHRLQKAIDRIQKVTILGKWNGAVGNYNAHVVAYPGLAWPVLARTFVESCGLVFNAYTTQIEPHDWLAEVLDALAAANTVLLGLSRDAWEYISRNNLSLRVAAGETGSSVMPHKVNPIDFENAEGNLGLSNALLRFMADKLPVSRMQRDLSDSTVLRNLGAAAGYALVAWDSLQRGLGKIAPRLDSLTAEMDSHWEVLAEAIQTVMRKHGLPAPYEQLKALTRGFCVDRAAIHTFLDGLEGIPAPVLAELKALTPATYLGAAPDLARDV